METEYELIFKKETDLFNKAKEIKNKGNNKAYFITEDGKKELIRFFILDNRIYQYIKGSSRRGYPLNILNYSDIQEKQIKPYSEKWRNDLKRVIIYLKGSGLWEDILKDVETALSIGYDKLKECQKITDTQYLNNYTDNKIEILLRLKEFEPRLIKVSEDGKDYINTTILWHLLNIKIKKMYFGKYQNIETLKEIAEALMNKTKVSITRYTNYDVSFEYNPEMGKAWYSEEYKNCGNGHYYLTLNSEYAIFWEDD